MAIKIVILYPAGIYVFQLKTRNNRSMCGICSELTLKTSKRRHGRHSGVFIVDFYQISPNALEFPVSFNN